MRIDSVHDIREFFKGELADEAFTIDKTGQRTIELIGANFLATEPAIFGQPSQAYINSELAWYESQSTNINDIYGPSKHPPQAWEYAADPHGNINSNYGHLVFSKKYHNQFQNAFDELWRNPDSRRAQMIYNRPSIWMEYNENGKSDFICTNAVTYYIRDNILHSVVQMRSNDAVFGYKNDYAWQSYMVHSISNNLEIDQGTIIWQVQNLHVYERHFDLVK